jgi:hypothetical protein
MCCHRFSQSQDKKLKMKMEALNFGGVFNENKRTKENSLWCNIRALLHKRANGKP